MGARYSLGIGLGDDILAAVYYKKGCDGGDAAGCFQLGLLHQRGNGAVQDLALAADDFQRACAQKVCNLGCANACDLLGHMYEDGSGVAKDASKARELYQRGCKAESRTVCASVSRLK